MLKRDSVGDITSGQVDLANEVTGTLPITNGGTNATTASSARTNLDTQQTLSGLSLTAVTVATDDKVLIQDTSDSNNLKTVTAQSIADLGGGGSSIDITDGTTTVSSATQASFNGTRFDVTDKGDGS